MIFTPEKRTKAVAVTPLGDQHPSAVAFDSDEENIMPIVSPSKGGLAFQVNIKSPNSSQVSPPGKIRLESYATSLSPVRAERIPLNEATPFRRLRSNELAEKAKEQNERKREKTERLAVKQQCARQQSAIELEEDLKKASEKRGQVLANRSYKAGKHFENVKANSETVQQQLTEKALVHQKQLAECLTQKSAFHAASLGERVEKASKHNESVKEKLQKCRFERLEREKQIMNKLTHKSHDPASVERAGKASQHNEAVLSKVQKYQKEQEKRKETLLSKLASKTGSKLDGRLPPQEAKQKIVVSLADFAV
jgi:hypothetical protein